MRVISSDEAKKKGEEENFKTSIDWLNKLLVTTEEEEDDKKRGLGQEGGVGPEVSFSDATGGWTLYVEPFLHGRYDIWEGDLTGFRIQLPPYTFCPVIAPLLFFQEETAIKWLFFLFVSLIK